MKDNKPVPFKISDSQQKYRRVHSSLNTVFTLSFSIVLVLSSIVALIAYDRLAAFEKLLDDTTATSFPKVMSYAKMYSQVNELTYATDSLTMANSQGQRRIAFDDLKVKISAIRPRVVELGNAQRLLMQLDVIAQEIDALNALIEEQLTISDLLLKQRRAVYRIHDIAIHDEELAHSDFAHTVSRLVIMAEEGLSFKRLNKIKNMSRNITKFYNRSVETLNFEDSQKLLLSDLYEGLVAADGAMAMKIQSLRVLGRTHGRADFVRNLVIDYARLAEYESFKYNGTVLEDIKDFSETVDAQTKTLGSAAIVTFVVIIIIVFYIQRRLIRRLVLLNKKVVSRLAGESIDLKVGGKDEITAIAKSFEEFAQTIERQKQELLKSSLTDGLTNVANRRGLDKAIKNLLLSAQRQQWPIAILMMDIDNFKKYNDFYGHIEGDECLQKIASALKSVMRRPEDFVARYGGEEFVCLLPNTPLSGAEIVADSILEQLKKDHIPHQRSDVADYVTLSIGITVYNAEKEESSDSLLKLADTALYRAKKRGKNCYST
ncbi:MAG: hypothetical protein BM565_03500 [Gammaproteobacteria bacterium MedPE]|nr:MAG: hypothetical protein BM565_03500 [Gammaproteobacteria bacterium MedPE]